MTAIIFITPEITIEPHYRKCRYEHYFPDAGEYFSCYFRQSRDGEEWKQLTFWTSPIQGLSAEEAAIALAIQQQALAEMRNADETFDNYNRQ